eukprot:scaffold48190_cov19-Tisochrysis_lutea.AAC.2
MHLATTHPVPHMPAPFWSKSWRRGACQQWSVKGNHAGFVCSHVCTLGNWGSLVGVPGRVRAAIMGLF